MKEVRMTDEQMEAMAPGEYTTWEKRVWRRGYEAALSQQPMQQSGGEAGESDGALLVRFGDAQKWAREFRATAIKLGYSDMDEGWLIGWFANAIEHSSDVRRRRTDTAPQSAPVGVDSIEANDSADYIELCASRLESFGKLVMAETLRAIAAEHRALAQPPACKSRVEQVAQEVLAEHEDDEAFDFLKAVVGKIVARATR